jgi:hypothetical protein
MYDYLYHLLALEVAFPIMHHFFVRNYRVGWVGLQIWVYVHSGPTAGSGKVEWAKKADKREKEKEKGFAVEAYNLHWSSILNPFSISSSLSRRVRRNFASQQLGVVVFAQVVASLVNGVMAGVGGGAPGSFLSMEEAGLG